MFCCNHNKDLNYEKNFLKVRVFFLKPLPDIVKYVSTSFLLPL